jgi:hypothetical protein
MFFRPSLRIFLIGPLVLSSLWVVLTFLPILYSIMFPRRNIQEIVRALESRGDAPPDARAAVEESISSDGLLRRTVQVGYYSGASAILQHNNPHSTRKTQVAYVAWFQKRPK